MLGWSSKANPQMKNTNRRWLHVHQWLCCLLLGTYGDSRSSQIWPHGHTTKLLLGPLSFPCLLPINVKLRSPEGMTEEARASEHLCVGLPLNTSTGMLLQEEEIKFYCGKPLRSCILSVTADGVTQMVTTSKDRRNVIWLSMLPNPQDSWTCIKI